MVRNGAWWTFFAGSLSCFLTGTTYTFGSWSSSLKQVFNYSQEDIESLALAKDIGNFICMDAGLMTGRYGPHVTLAVGSLGMVVSCLAIWQALRAGGQAPFAVMIFLCWLFGHSLGYADNAGISTSVRNFPKQKGSAVGLMKALEGITAAVICTIFYTVWSDGDLVNFPLLLAATGIVIGLIATPVMMATNAPSDEPDSVVATKFALLVVALLCYIFFCAGVGLVKAYNAATMAVAVGALFSLAFLAYPVGTPESTGVFAARTIGAVVGDRPNLSGREMLVMVDFYLVWFTLIILQGCGIMFSNNLGQIVVALREDPAATAGTQLTIFSVFNGMGRVLFGFGSEALKGQVNRPWFLVVSSLLMTACMALLPLFEAWLGVVAAVLGLSLGGTFALQAVVVEEVFGPKDMPLKYSFCFTAACLGSLIFSDLLAGRVYDAEAQQQDTKKCLGSSCFATTFYVTAACCALAFLSSLLLSVRSRGTYRKVNASFSSRQFVSDPHVSLTRASSS